MQIVVLLFALLGHGYLWIGIVNPLHAIAGYHRLIDAISWLCAGVFFVLPLVVLWQWSQSTEGLSPGSLFNGYVLFCTGFGAAKLLFINRYYDHLRDHPDTLRSSRRSWPLATAVPPSELTHGLYPRLLAEMPGNQLFSLVIDHKQIVISNLPSELAGMKIAHLSDLHMTGRVDCRWYQKIVEEVNAHKPDMIAITGDIVERESCWPWLEESLAKLRAPRGIYYVLGNHDFYIDSQKTRQLLNDAGWIDVGGRMVKAEWNQAPILIAGNELPWGRLPEPLRNSPTDHIAAELRLALLHTPDQFHWAASCKMHLAMAGHTHGGQIRFPLLGAVACPSLYGTRYACGVFRQNETALHVTRGLGGKTPLRWNCPPEIAMLELVPARA